MARRPAARSLAAMNQHALTLRTSQALLALMGAVVCFGSIYFGVIAPVVENGPLDYAVGAWAFAMALAMLVCAVRLPGSDATRVFAIRLLTLHFAFGIVKVLGYDEPEAGLFMAFDLALIGLLAASARR